MNREKLREAAISFLNKKKNEGKPFMFLNEKYKAHYLKDAARVIILYGSRGSAKSHSVVQKMLLMAEGKYYFRGLVMRKTFRALRKSCWKLFLDIIKDTNRVNSYKINRSEFVITNRKTGNEIYFAGLDDPDKIKGIVNPTYAWFEEPNTDGVTLKDFNTVQTSMRGVGDEYKQTVLTFNSDDEETWIKSVYFPEGLAFEQELPHNFLIPSTKKNVKIVHSTYNDNIFIDKDSIEAYESLAEIDPDLHKVYAKGLFGGKVKGKIFENYQSITDYDAKKSRYTCYAIDWGWNDPMVLVECKLIDGELYFSELYYESKKHVEKDLIPFLEEHIKDRKAPIYCDHEPANIEILRTRGFNAVKAKKGAGTIKEGISRLKAYSKFHIDAASDNLLKELAYYKWKYNPKSDKFEDEPVDIFNHAIDCLRYVVNSDMKIKADFKRKGLDKRMRK